MKYRQYIFYVYFFFAFNRPEFDNRPLVSGFVGQTVVLGMRHRCRPDSLSNLDHHPMDLPRRSRQKPDPRPVGIADRRTTRSQPVFFKFDLFFFFLFMYLLCISLIFLVFFRLKKKNSPKSRWN